MNDDEQRRTDIRCLLCCTKRSQSQVLEGFFRLDCREKQRFFVRLFSFIRFTNSNVLIVQQLEKMLAVDLDQHANFVS